ISGSRGWRRRSHRRRRRRSSWRGASVRGAARRPSSSRKGARSATGGASKSAKPPSLTVRLPRPPALLYSPGRGRRGGGPESAANMNPSIPTNYLETGAWLEGFIRSHAKREDVRIEVLLDMAGPREGRSYGLRLRLGPHASPPLGSPPIELDFQ